MSLRDYGVGILGTGHSLPERVETNAELCAVLPDTTPEWIVEKTGITQRYLAEPDDSAADYAVRAARKALDMAGVDAAEVLRLASLLGILALFALGGLSLPLLALLGFVGATGTVAYSVVTSWRLPLPEGVNTSRAKVVVWPTAGYGTPFWPSWAV